MIWNPAQGRWSTWAIDQGGCFETSRPTTHEDPVYYVDGMLHYCVANIPGAVPRTSTLALTNATLPYAIQLADKGWRRAAKENPELALGLNIIGGKVVYKPVARRPGAALRTAGTLTLPVPRRPSESRNGPKGRRDAVKRRIIVRKFVPIIFEILE